jgi:predicted GIY-YIG superfamily endonuclease
MSTVVRKQRVIHQNNTDNKNNKYRPNPYRAWEKEDEKEDVFYVYILNFDNGSYYIGHSKELRGRILEIRNDNNISDFGKEPKLQYFEIHPNRQAAMMREAEIKEIYKNNNREISRMITRFSDLVKELDFE